MLSRYQSTSRRSAATALARRYWPSAALLLAALLAGAASWVAFDRGTAAPRELADGSIDLITTDVTGRLDLYVNYLIEAPKSADTGQLSAAEEVRAGASAVGDLRDARGMSITLLSKGMKPGARMAWSLQLAGSARMSDVFIDLGSPLHPGKASQSRAWVTDDPLVTSCYLCQNVQGESFADDEGSMTVSIRGGIEEPVAAYGAGLTYVQLPSIQGGRHGFTAIGSPFRKPDRLTVHALAGRLRAGDAISSIYPENGLQPVSSDLSLPWSRPGDEPGLLVQWSGKELPTLRADITDREEQRRASVLVFAAGGLVGLATGLLVEALLQFREVVPRPQPFGDNATRRRFPTMSWYSDRH
jgi:hypothetical protein